MALGKTPLFRSGQTLERDTDEGSQPSRLPANEEIELQPWRGCSGQESMKSTTVLEEENVGEGIMHKVMTLTRSTES